MGCRAWLGTFFVTQDLDFSDMRQFKLGAHPGLLLVRLHEPGANALRGRISAVVEAHALESWVGCFVVLTRPARGWSRISCSKTRRSRATRRTG
jgi:hypothetical protein